MIFFQVDSHDFDIQTLGNFGFFFASPTRSMSSLCIMSYNLSRNGDIGRLKKNLTRPGPTKIQPRVDAIRKKLTLKQVSCAWRAEVHWGQYRINLDASFGKKSLGFL